MKFSIDLNRSVFVIGLFSFRVDSFLERKENNFVRAASLGIVSVTLNSDDIELFNSFHFSKASVYVNRFTIKYMI